MASVRSLLRLRKAPADVAVPGVRITGLIPVTWDEDQIFRPAPGQSYAFTATGGTTPYTWSISAGSLPTGLTLNTSTGAVTGTPTTAGVFAYTIRVTDAVASADSIQTQLDIIATDVPLAILTTAGSVRDAEIGVAYTFTFQPVVGSGSGTGYTWDVITGALPTGSGSAAFSLSTGGVLTCTSPSGPQTDVQFTVRLRDSLGASATLDVTMSVVTAVDEYAYFTEWAAHDELHNTGFPAIPHDATSKPGNGWAAWKMTGANAQAIIDATVDKITVPRNYSYSASDNPPNVKVTMFEDDVHIAGDQQLDFPLCGNDPGTQNIVLVYDEYFPTNCITAQQAVPSFTAEANVSTHKWRQIGEFYAGTSRWLEFRSRWETRNRAVFGDVAEASPNRRVLRWDLRIYDDQGAQIGGGVPQYCTNGTGYTPTGLYGETSGAPPSYENRWVRHIIQVRQRIRGSEFTSWAQSAGGEGAINDGIVDNSYPVTIASTGTTATVTLAGHGWKADQKVTIRGADQSAYNGFITIASVPTVNTFTYTMASDPGVSAATGSVTAGTDYAEVSWWIGNQNESTWHCVVYKVPAFQQQNGIRKWWAEHNTSSSKAPHPVFELTRSGSTATVVVCKATPASASITRSGTTATVTATNHGLNPTAAHRWVLIKGADQVEYNGDFDATYVDANTFTVQVTGTPATPATGTILWAQQIDGWPNKQSIRIEGATGGSAGFNGDWEIVDGSRFDPDAPEQTQMTFTVSGTPTSPATGTIVARRALLADMEVYLRGAFVLENYDSPGMAVGAGVQDPVSSPSSYDTSLFQLPKSH